MPVLRQTPGVSLGDLSEELHGRTSGASTEDLALSEIEFNFNNDEPTFKLGRDEVPTTQDGVLAFGGFLGVPTPFLKRLHKNAGLAFIEELFGVLSLTTEASAARVTYTPTSVHSVRSVNTVGVEPVQLVDTARRILSNDSSEVVRLIDNPSQFAFDVRVPEDAARGVGGDRAVGDITTGGLRFNLDIKNGHAPEVQPYLYRLWCTNGMSSRDEGLKLDARGQSVEEVLADLEAMADRAFSRVERQIGHFYNLRNERIDNPERALRAIADENGIPNRSLVRLLDLAASNELPENPSQFDITNLVTNLANDESVRNDGGRLLLENAGGAIISDEAARCPHCQQKTVH